MASSGPPAPAHEAHEAEPSFAIDRASFEHLVAGEPGACGEDRIRAAIERADHDDAAIRALARAKLGLPLPPDLVADILVGVEQMSVFFTLARLMGREGTEPLLDLLLRGRLADDAMGFDQTSYTAFALWQLQAPEQAPERVRSAIVPPLRRLARERWLPLRTAGLVGWLAARLGDPHLSRLHEEHQEESGGQRLAELAGQHALEVWETTVDGLVALLAERAPPRELPGGVPIRVEPKVGRNEPCPCGSGKKFKRCCADKPAPVPIGVDPSHTQRLRALEPRLDVDQIGLLARADLAGLELPRLRDAAVAEVMRRQGQLRDWRRACLAADELARRGIDDADGFLEEVIHEAFVARQYDVGRQLLARLPEAAAPDLRLQAALAAREPGALAQLEAAALAVVEAPRPAGRAADLAHAALATLPGLGILIARGALQASLLDAEVLLDAIEEARDELGLPPGDPAQELFEALGGVHERKRDETASAVERARLARTAAGLRADLEASTTRLAAMERQIAEHRRELERADRTSAAASQRATRTAAEEQERRALRSKIEELQGRIREGNEERGELRRQLSQAGAGKLEAQAAHEARSRGRGPEEPDEAAAVEDLPGEAAARAVQLPRFGAAVEAALEAAPRNVAAAAMRTIGALAAGDPAAWRGVKQAKDMPRQVLMARVGIHHRLLFRADGDLDVLDLITRESLMTTLKRLRSS